MSEYKGYTKAAGQATARYKKEHRDSLKLDLPKGKKEEYRAQAEAKGYKSLTAYIVALIEGDR